jgi:hypothetical protein
MQIFSGSSLFWIVLALFYLILALITYISSRPIKYMFSKLAEEGADSVLEIREGEEISLNSTIYKAYKSIIITDIIGFILATVAAGISLFI